MTATNYKVTFSTKPKPLFPGYRPLYKVAIILVVLKVNSVGGKSSLLKLHLFSWALKSHSNLQRLKEYALDGFHSSKVYFGIEPSLNRALLLAIGENLIIWNGDKYEITAKGEQFFELIWNDNELFAYEKGILKAIGKKINETKIEELRKFWKNA